MSESVAVIHGQPGRDFSAQMPYALVWRTCLREIAIIDSRHLRSEDLKPSDHVYVGEDGYRFLLEVICGLHSPLVGETEVFGQFKNFAVRAQEGPGGRCMAPWIQRLIGDAKRVRTNHLTGLGGRSYGQLAHRRLGGCRNIVILGAGHLAQETIPTLADHHVLVFCRRPAAAAELLGRHRDGAIHHIDDTVAIGADEAAGLIIAAPMTAAEITAWVTRSGFHFETIVDLRGESACDSLEIEGTNVINFKDIVETLETNNRFASQRLESAKKEISARTAEFWERYAIRPFGWEDLCA